MSGFSREDTINDTAFVNISGPNIHISSSFPDLLCQNVYLTPEQDKSIGYTSIDSRPRTLCSDEARDLLYRYFPEGILSNLDVDIREELLLKGYASENEQFSTDTYLDRNDAKIIPGVDLMVKRITRVATTIIESCFDENAKQRFHNRAIAKASLCVGDDRNKYTSTIRIHLIDPNSSPTLIRVLEDDPALYTVRSESPSTQIAWRILNISSTPRHRSRWTISRSNMPTNLPRILQHGTIYRTGVQKNNAIL
ncbi:hypothetical protein ACHAQE_008705 [Botrytis cinerea]